MDFPSAMGTLVMNLQTLECALRAILHELHTQSGGPKLPVFSFDSCACGDWVPETPLTNYDTLGQVIIRFNSMLSSRGIAERIDMSLVGTRDAIAHGRVLTDDPGRPMRLFKFSKPKGNKVQITVFVEMTHEWFKGEVQKTFAEVQKIVKISRDMGLNTFPAG
jgi:hypothetical protein